MMQRPSGLSGGLRATPHPDFPWAPPAGHPKPFPRRLAAGLDPAGERRRGATRWGAGRSTCAGGGEWGGTWARNLEVRPPSSPRPRWIDKGAEAHTIPMALSRKHVLEGFLAAGALVLAGILVALPSPGRRDGHDQELQDRLALLRAAVFRFSMDHRDAHGALYPGQAGADLVLQLTGPSRADGSTAAPLSGPDDRWFGPYLRAIPVNPVNGRDSIRVLSQEAREPQARGTAGWIYLPATGRVHPDLPGADPDGTPYTRY